jgi:hypothetical protein
LITLLEKHKYFNSLFLQNSRKLGVFFQLQFISGAISCLTASSFFHITFSSDKELLVALFTQGKNAIPLNFPLSSGLKSKPNFNSCLLIWNIQKKPKRALSRK